MYRTQDLQAYLFHEKRDKAWRALRMMATNQAEALFSTDLASKYTESMARKGHTSISDMMLYGCVRCESIFPNPSDLRQHADSCKLQRPFFCTLCMKRFAEIESLEVHMQEHALRNPSIGNKEGRSVYGNADTSPGNSLREDTSNVSLGSEWEYDELLNPPFSTNDITVSKEHLSDTIKTETPEGLDDGYNSNEWPDISKDTHKLESNAIFTCEVCFQIFGTKESLQMHLAIHYDTDKSQTNYEANDGDYQYPAAKTKHQCDLCGKYLSKAYHLRRHKQLVHPGPASCVCPVCSRTFDNRRQLANHIRVHKVSPDKSKAQATDQVPDPKVGEGKADKGNNEVSSADEHTNMLTLQQPTDVRSGDLNTRETPVEDSDSGSDIQCHEVKLESTLDSLDDATSNVPNAELGSTDSMRKSKQGNKGLPHNYSCNDCGRTFSRYNYLQNHRLTHSGFFRYKCAHCNKKFRLKRALVAHSRIHKWSTHDKFGGARANVCDECGRAFSRSSHLRVHKASVHTAPGSQICGECHKAFDTRRQLANHVRTHIRTLDSQTGIESETLTQMLNELLKTCPYQCHLCSLSFVDANDFEGHFGASHPELFFPDRVVNEELKTEPREDMDSDDEEEGNESTQDSHDSVETKNSVVNTGEKDAPDLFVQKIIENRRFVCSVCKTVFNRLYHLKRHLTKHIDIRLHACTVCEKKFKTKETLKSHLELHNTDTVFPCTMCEKSFFSAKRLKVHSECHLTEKNFQCDECGLSFPSLNRLHQHQKCHRPGKFECTECARVFGRREHLKVHMQSHRDPSEKPVLCELCGVRVWSQYLLKKHMLVHTGQMPFTCETCGKQFKQSQSLKDHMYIHTGEPKPHPCNLCDKRCSLPSELRKHIRERHGEKRHVCTVCGKKFSRMNQLTTHTRLTHTAVRSHACPQCEKVFKTPTNLQLHLKRHENVWSQACQFCNAMFVDRFLLRQHEDEHRGKIRPHACNQCERRFNDMATLKKHRQLVHHKGERHACDRCDMVFTFIEDLQKHQLTHSLERPYECEFCKLRFARKYHVERHVKSHHSPGKAKQPENSFILNM